MRSPYPKIVSHSACTLLEKWYRYTREATVRAVFPEVGYAWRRKGLAWECTVAPILSRPEGGRKPPRHPDWQESGHAFLKVCPSEHEALVLDFLFGEDSDLRGSRWARDRREEIVSAVARRHGYGHAEAKAIIMGVLRAYQDECENRGLLRVVERNRQTTSSTNSSITGETMAYYTSLKEIAAHFGVSVNTIRAWIELDPTFPAKRSPSGRYITTPEDLDRWYATRDDGRLETGVGGSQN